MRTNVLSKNTLLFLLLVFICGNSVSQQLSLKTGLYSFFDNREYFNDYANDQTIFGVRAYALGTIKLDQKNEFTMGLDGLYEFGSTLDAGKIEPILYIHHNNKVLDLYMGSFYRHPIVAIPNVLLNDTLQYYKPNIQGIYIGYNKENFFHNVWIDWTSRQTEVNKEVFVIGGTGCIYFNKFFYKHDLIMTHYALTSSGNPDEHIRDNGGIYFRLGITSDFFIFDTLTLSAGMVCSYDRTRNVTPLEYSNGVLSELCLQYKVFGFHYTYYSGTGQDIITGDPLYKAEFYNRFDLSWRIFDYPGIKGEVEISVHLVGNEVDYSQKFTLRADLEQNKNLKPFDN
jgi:hypothetical protein